jgi:hypothetical protein
VGSKGKAILNRIKMNDMLALRTEVQGISKSLKELKQQKAKVHSLPYV